MLLKQPVGQGASAVKYDVLCALGAWALRCDKHMQRRVLRLTVLITARYNWKTRDLSMGRAEMARLWAVDERTVKRELAWFRAEGWMTVKRPAARGRVAVYNLHLDVLLKVSQPVWHTLGPDFDARLSAMIPASAEPVDNVVPFIVPTGQGHSDWDRVRARLVDTDPTLWSAWYQHLELIETRDGIAHFTAPSRFVADYISAQLRKPLIRALNATDAQIRDFRIARA